MPEQNSTPIPSSSCPLFLFAPAVPKVRRPCALTFSSFDAASLRIWNGKTLAAGLILRFSRHMSEAIKTGSKLSACSTRQQGWRKIRIPCWATWQGGRPPIASPVPLCAACGNRARFRAFRLVWCRYGVIVPRGAVMTPYDHCAASFPAKRGNQQRCRASGIQAQR